MIPITKLLKNKVINSIKILGIGIKELVIDIELSEFTINSIEYDEKNDNVLVHIFNDNLDIMYEFDGLCEKDKLKVIKMLDSI